MIRFPVEAYNFRLKPKLKVARFNRKPCYLYEIILAGIAVDGGRSVLVPAGIWSHTVYSTTEYNIWCNVIRESIYVYNTSIS